MISLGLKNKETRGFWAGRVISVDARGIGVCRASAYLVVGATDFVQGALEWPKMQK